MKKLLIFFLVVLACSAVYGKFRAESKIEEVLNMGIMMAQSQADISYDDVIVNLDSSISITNLNFHDKTRFNSFSIEEINFLSSNNWRIFTSFFSPIQKTLTKYIFERPDKIKFSFHKVNMRGDGFSKHEYLCGFSSQHANASLADIGYDKLNWDFSFSINAKDKTQAKLYIQQSIIGVADLDIYSELNFGAGSSTVINPAAFDPKTIDVGIVLDEDYANDVRQHCSEINNFSGDDFVLAQLAALNASQEGGLTIPQETIDAFTKFMQGGTRLELSSTPKIKFSELDKLEHYKAEDRFKLLGLTIDIEGTRIPNEFIEQSIMNYISATANQQYAMDTKEPGKLTEKIASIEVVNTPTIEEASKEVALIEKTKQSGPQELKFSELKNYIGEYIKVKRRNAEDIDGKLLSYQGGILEIERRMFGGSIDYHISKKDISSLEVIL